MELERVILGNLIITATARFEAKAAPTAAPWVKADGRGARQNLILSTAVSVAC